MLSDCSLLAFAASLITLVVFVRHLVTGNSGSARWSCLFGAAQATCLALVAAFHFCGGHDGVATAGLVPGVLRGPGGVLALLIGGYLSVKNAYDRLGEFQEHLPPLRERIEEAYRADLALALEPDPEVVDEFLEASGWILSGAQWVTAMAVCANALLLLSLLQHFVADVLAVAVWVWGGLLLSGFCLHIWMRERYRPDSCLC